MAEKKVIQDTERPHWLSGLDEEMKRVLTINDKPKCAETSAKGEKNE